MKRYTIHSKDAHTPYTAQVSDDTSRCRTHVMVFRRKCDASKMARMMESHYRTHGSWPYAEISPTSKLTIEGSGIYKNGGHLEHTYVRTWMSDDLFGYVATYLLHMMYFSKLSQQETEMETVVFDYLPDYIRERISVSLD